MTDILTYESETNSPSSGDENKTTAVKFVAIKILESCKNECFGLVISGAAVESRDNLSCCPDYPLLRHILHLTRPVKCGISGPRED